MRYRAKKSFSSTRFGNITCGNIIDIDPTLAPALLSAGLIELIVPEPPKYFAGSESQKPASSSHPGRASPENNATMPPSSSAQTGAESSQSIPVSEPCQSVDSSMPATASGGNTTTPKRRGRPKNGQATNGQQKTTG